MQAARKKSVCLGSRSDLRFMLRLSSPRESGRYKVGGKVGGKTSLGGGCSG